MEFYKRNKNITKQSLSSRPRSIYDLEVPEVNAFILLREKNANLSEYLKDISHYQFKQTLIISNALEDTLLDDFFKELPRDYDDMRKGHELLKEEVISFLKMLTPLNPRKSLKIELLSHIEETSIHSSNDELNLVCSYLQPCFEWVVFEKKESYILEKNHVAVFKGHSFSSSSEPLCFKFLQAKGLILKISSYIIEH